MQPAYLMVPGVFFLLDSGSGPSVEHLADTNMSWLCLISQETPSAQSSVRIAEGLRFLLLGRIPLFLLGLSFSGGEESPFPLWFFSPAHGPRPAADRPGPGGGVHQVHPHGRGPLRRGVGPAAQLGSRVGTCKAETPPHHPTTPPPHHPTTPPPHHPTTPPPHHPTTPPPHHPTTTRPGHKPRTTFSRWLHAKMLIAHGFSQGKWRLKIDGSQLERLNSSPSREHNLDPHRIWAGVCRFGGLISLSLEVN